jgi:VWFA-related protein
MRKKATVGICVVAVAVVAAALPADPAQFGSRVEMVAVVTTVLGDDGRVVPGLSASNFSIQEDGKTRPIATFVNERLPISLVVALDTSKSMSGDRLRFAKQAVSILAESMAPGDEVGVAGFANAPYLITPLTADVEQITTSLSSVEADGATALYDGVGMALELVGNSINRRAAVVVIGDGNDNPLPRNPGPPDRVRLDQARLARERGLVDRLRRTGALLYGIQVSSPTSYLSPSNGPLDNVALARLAEPTGGFAQNVTSVSDLPRVARAIREELEQQYILGFVAEHGADGKFHRLRVAVRGCACRVRARTGFAATASRGRFAADQVR